MAAATSIVTTRDGKTLNALAFEVLNAEVVWPGEFQAVGGPTHGTAAAQGRQDRFTGAAGEIPVGFPNDKVTGDTTPPSTGKILGTNDVRCMVRRIPCTLTGDRTDVGKVVYMTDGNAWTTTRPTLGIPYGIVVEPISSTEAWIMNFSFEVLCALALCGSGSTTWFLGLMTAGAATGNVATGIVAPFHGKILNFYGIVVVEATDADVVHAINLEIGGTNVTGGALAWDFDDAVGQKNSATAITAANEFHEGDLIDVETTASVAGTVADPGLLALYVDVEAMPGL